MSRPALGPAGDPVPGGAVREGTQRERQHSDADRHLGRPLPRRRPPAESRLVRTHRVRHRGRRLGRQRPLQEQCSLKLERTGCGVSVLSSLPAVLAFRVVWIVDDALLGQATTTDGTAPPLKPFCQPLFPVLGGTDTSQLVLRRGTRFRDRTPGGGLRAKPRRSTNKASKTGVWEQKSGNLSNKK